MKKFTVFFALLTMVSIVGTSQPQLTWRFANVEVINAGSQLQFDVEVKASVAGSFHRDLQIYFDYNTAGFGSNIVASANVTYTPLTLMNTHYSVVNMADNTSSKFAIITEANNEMTQSGSAAYFNEMTTSFQGLLRFTIDITDNSQAAGIAFDQTLMNGGQYYQSTSNTNPLSYLSPCVYDNNLSTFKLSLLYGVVSYANASSTPLKNCTINLYSGAVLMGTDVTVTGGQYGFSGQADGSYTLQTTCTLSSVGFNIADALYLRQSLNPGGPILTPLQTLAGDVTWNGFTNIQDVFVMRQKLAGVPNTWAAPDYVFLTGNATITSGIGMLNYQGLCSGDVNGTGIPPL